MDGAAKIGKIIGERAIEKKIHKVVFDIGAYKYHGKIKAIIEGAKAVGLNSDESDVKSVKSTKTASTVNTIKTAKASKKEGK